MQMSCLFLYFPLIPSCMSHFACHHDITLHGAWLWPCHLPGLLTPSTWQYSVRKCNIQVITNDVEAVGYHVQANSASVSAPLYHHYAIFDHQNGISRGPCKLFGLFSGFCRTSNRVLSSK